jgi:hypothetical protein
LTRIHGLKQGDEDPKTGSDDQQERKAPDDVGPKPENREKSRRFVGRRRGLGEVSSLIWRGSDAAASGLA